MTVVLQYSSVTHANDPREVFGLQVAVSRWMKAYFRYSQQDHFSFLIGAAAAWQEIQNFAATAGIDPQRLRALDQRHARTNLAAFDTIFRPDPHPQKLLWQRQQVPGTPPNLCTLAHAISGLEAGELLERYCLDPSTATDAIICPSRAVGHAIRSFWNLYSDYLQQRFGTAFHCPVQLPVIPLGIDTDHFAALTTADKRATQRTALGMEDADIVLLWVGRLSHAIKAHPLAMFQAAERTAVDTGARIHLVMVGYFVPTEAAAQFQDLARDFCTTATVHFIASDDVRFPDGLWAAGDIFLSLVDNMQESFGLTPIEAMAAGLPRVISDWDGYRDSVTHGVDGFLIPTLQPPAGQGRALSELLLDNREIYGGFLAKTAQCVAIDTDQAVQAITRLIRNPGLRRTMAAAARQRAKTTYDWRHIIPAYEALWAELATQRAAVTHPRTVWPSALPQAPDPFSMYAAYPIAALAENGHLRVIASVDMIKKLWRHDINILALDVMLTPDNATQIINYVAAHGHPGIGQILDAFAAQDRPALWRTLGWLIKLGILAYD